MLELFCQEVSVHFCNPQKQCKMWWARSFFWIPSITVLTPAGMFPLKATCHSLFHQLPERGPGYRLCGQPLEALPSHPLPRWSEFTVRWHYIVWELWRHRNFKSIPLISSYTKCFKIKVKSEVTGIPIKFFRWRLGPKIKSLVIYQQQQNSKSLTAEEIRYSFCSVVFWTLKYGGFENKNPCQFCFVF